jgi:hypothetical protein
MSQKLEYELKGKSDVEQVTGRAKKSVETLGQSFKKAGDDIVKKFTGMFAGAVLFDKALSFISGTFKQLGEVADQVDRSGLSAAQFQALAYAAQQSGVSVSVLAKATRQLRVDMAEAAAGTGKKVELFKALGVSMEQLKSGDATSVFLAISKAMEGSADDSEKLLITTAMFGDKIGNDIIPLLASFEKLQKDIAAAPIVDEKTLKLIGEYNDGVDRLSAKLQVLAARFFQVYDAYSKWMSKVSEDVANGMFGLLNKVGIGDAASTATQLGLKFNPMAGPLVSMGADGSRAEPGAAPTANNAQRTKTLLDIIKAGTKTEKDKSADTKGKDASVSSVSGNVIGVGQNPVVSAIHEQVEVAKQSLDYLRMIASQKGSNLPSPGLTDKGATPITPASRS